MPYDNEVLSIRHLRKASSLCTIIMICRLTLFLLVLTVSTRPTNAQKIDTIYSSDFIKIIGDTSIAGNNIENVLIRFEPYISFQDFPAKTFYKGVKTPIDYNSNITAKRYKTRITETYKSEGINFAGHYCFVVWGCGSACRSSAIVDLRTGKVYDGPSASYGFEFNKDSNMVIVNPPEPSGFIYDCPTCYPEIWVWNDKTKKFIQKMPYKK